MEAIGSGYDVAGSYGGGGKSYRVGRPASLPSLWGRTNQQRQWARSGGYIGSYQSGSDSAYYESGGVSTYPNQYKKVSKFIWYNRSINEYTCPGHFTVKDFVEDFFGELPEQKESAIQFAKDLFMYGAKAFRDVTVYKFLPNSLKAFYHYSQDWFFKTGNGDPDNHLRQFNYRRTIYVYGDTVNRY